MQRRVNLPGRLRSTTLGDLLGQLHRAGQSGILELVELTGRSHRVFLDAGLVDHVETDLPATRLGELLTGEGLLSAEDLACLARRLSEEPAKRTGEILIEQALVSEPEVKAGLHKQLMSRLEALFRVSEALVRFHVRPPRRERVPPAKLGPHEFLHDRPRARARRGDLGARTDRTHALRVLGLCADSDRQAIQSAFRRLASNSHPDRHPTADAGERARLLRRFVELSAAYHTLTR